MCVLVQKDARDETRLLTGVWRHFDETPVRVEDAKQFFNTHVYYPMRLALTGITNDVTLTSPETQTSEAPDHLDVAKTAAAPHRIPQKKQRRGSQK